MEKPEQDGHERESIEGKISFRGMSIDCVARDLCPAGALLDVETPLGIPTRFLLLVPARSLKRECRISWIKDKQIGVRFDRSASGNEPLTGDGE
jgi:hypothetical protein